MLYLLRYCAVFVELPRCNFMQVSGKPMTSWLPRRARVIQPRGKRTAAADVPGTTNKQAKITPQLTVTDRMLLNRGPLFYATQLSDGFPVDHPLRRFKPSHAGARQLVDHIFGTGSQIPKAVQRVLRHLDVFKELLHNFQRLRRLDLLER